MSDRPDYPHWFQKPVWRLDDAVLIVMGIDPESQRRPRMRPMGGLRMKTDDLPSVFWDFLDIAMKTEGRDLDVIEYSSGKEPFARYGKVKPVIFVKWAKQAGYLIPQGLLDCIKGTEQRIISHKDENTPDIQQGRREGQVESIKKAISKLGYDPLEIPTGGKQMIKALCENDYRLFAGKNSFNNAWKEARRKELVRMEDHDSFAN